MGRRFNRTLLELPSVTVGGGCGGGAGALELEFGNGPLSCPTPWQAQPFITSLGTWGQTAWFVIAPAPA